MVHPKTLQDVLDRALTLEAGLQLAVGVHLGRSPQVMQVSTDISCHQERLKDSKGVYTKLMLEIAGQGLMPV